MTFRYNCLAGKLPAQVAIPIVFVVDQDRTVRESLCSMIEACGWRAVLAASAEDFLVCSRSVAPSCLITELRLPGLSGLDLQRHAGLSGAPTIFMSDRADAREIVQAMKGGALEFLTKPVPLELLRQVIRDAIDRSRTLLTQRERVNALQERYQSLSRREREVMSLVVSGRLNKQVGGDLGISEITVKAHRGKLMRKMQAASFAELVNMAATLRA